MAFSGIGDFNVFVDDDDKGCAIRVTSSDITQHIASASNFWLIVGHCF
jgi:hypothetical protein